MNQENAAEGGSNRRSTRAKNFVVGGYAPGNRFDAVIEGYYDGDNLLYTGKVRASFVPHLRREVMS